MKKTNETTDLKYNGTMLVCPNCGELLVRADIEAFMRCPFCDTMLKSSNATEDLLFRQAIEDWYKMNLSQIQKLGSESENARTNWL